MCVLEGLPRGGPFLYVLLMILVVKNNPGSVQNTVYLTPKEKRGTANVAEFGATINGMGMEIKSLTTDKTVMVNARVLTVTDRFTTFVFDAEVPSANTSVDLSGPSWPEGYIQYRIVERDDENDVRDITASDVILGGGVGVSYPRTPDGNHPHRIRRQHHHRGAGNAIERRCHGNDGSVPRNALRVPQRRHLYLHVL